jgi:hypothetical protein
MAAVLLALALAVTTPATGDVHCDLRRLSACRDTNELIWDKTFEGEVQRFLGRRRASYLGRPGGLADQMIEVLGGPPDDPTKIGSRFRFTACRAHSCDEKGAAVLEPDGRLVALAILHSACGAPHAANDCFAHETLDIFARSPVGADVVDNLSSWARSEIAQGYTAPGEPADRLDAVRVTAVK